MSTSIYSPAGAGIVGYRTVRTNLCENPAVALATTGYTGTAGGTSPTVSRQATPSVPGVSFYAYVPVTAPATYIDARYGGPGLLPVVAGSSYTFSGWFHNSKAATDVTIFVQWFDAGGSIITTSTAVQGALASAWRRYSTVALLAPAGAVRAVVIFRGTWAAVSGDFVGLTAVLAEQASVLGSFFHGSTPASGDFIYGWIGASHASPSVQQEAIQGVPSSDPLLLTGYRATRETTNRIHPIIGRDDPDVTLGPPGLRTGTLEFLFDSETAAFNADTLHRQGGYFTLTDSDRPNVNMSYIAGGAIEVELEDETRSLWLVRVDFQEVLP